MPVLLWGIWPRQPLALAGLVGAGQLPLTLGAALGRAGAGVWGSLAISGLAGVALGWLHPRVFAYMRGWQETISTVVSLDWLYRGLIFALQSAGDGLAYFARLSEGEGYVGWVVLAALVLWVLLKG